MPTKSEILNWRTDHLGAAAKTWGTKLRSSTPQSTVRRGCWTGCGVRPVCRGVSDAAEKLYRQNSAKGRQIEVCQAGCGIFRTTVEGREGQGRLCGPRSRGRRLQRERGPISHGATVTFGLGPSEEGNTSEVAAGDFAHPGAGASGDG